MTLKQYNILVAQHNLKQLWRKTEKANTTEAWNSWLKILDNFCKDLEGYD